ncbi:glycosyltransferase [Canibacter zhuwentaonis]|uniref:glycosyltransferase n=1 Tax=Canibacter zhuwentaonis TaxID=2837491 RepID=UPI0032B5B95E
MIGFREDRIKETVSVTAVIVSHNRKHRLKESLHALSRQTVWPERIIVVDNASTDGSVEYAADALGLWPREVTVELIDLDENTGGAGGFAVGIAAALVPTALNNGGDNSRQGVSDWIWVMDDDTIPHPTALGNAVRAHSKYAAAGPDHLAVMGSRVEWVDGSDHPMNTPKPKIGARRAERLRAEASNCMEIRSISFVSAFLRTSRVLQEGLPVASYFLWNDDFEYSARLLNGARGLCVLDSVVTHKTATAKSSDTNPGARFKFEVRNKIWVFTRSRALQPWERVAYTGASVRRWLRTFIKSTDRSALLQYFLEGLREGITTKPETNAQALQNAEVPHAIAEVLKNSDADTFRLTKRRRKQ